MRIFGQHEQTVIDQLARCVEPEEGAHGVLCADGHYGYSQPVGGAVAYRDHISPAGVGYDIGCGNKAVLTDLTADDVDGAVPHLMDEIARRIAFGVGLPNEERADHPVLDEIREAPVGFQRELFDLAARQLGTVGGGNHYVDLFRDEQGRVWVGVHFGSRGFGHRTASRYFGQGPMDSAPELLPIGSERGQEYIAAMELAGRYAYAGRDVVVAKVLKILGARATYEVHNHHNYAWREDHGGEQWWVVRKGCTPAFPGQQGFVGATMAGTSVILEGVESADSAEAFYSTVHGAGRAMSRTQAAGKFRKVRDPETGRKRRFRDVSTAAIHWPAVEQEMRARGIELRGANAEEAPGAYKDLREVLEHHAGTVRVLHELTPVGVAMAPGDVVDPYKD
jgi:tRNA-splicing ligase RtcB